MVISIPNDVELYAQQMALGVENKPILSLLKAMQRFYTEEPFHETSLEVQINPELLSDGYRINPSMLAKNAHLNIFTYFRGVVRGDYVVILFTNNSDEGVPFMQRLKDFLAGEDTTMTLEIPLEEVPDTYRFGAQGIAALRYRLKRLGLSVNGRANKTHWIYRHAKK